MATTTFNMRIHNCANSLWPAMNTGKAKGYRIYKIARKIQCTADRYQMGRRIEHQWLDNLWSACLARNDVQLYTSLFHCPLTNPEGRLTLGKRRKVGLCNLRCPFFGMSQMSNQLRVLGLVEFIDGQVVHFRINPFVDHVGIKVPTPHML